MKWILRGSAKEYAQAVRSCACVIAADECCSCIFYDLTGGCCCGIDDVVDLELTAEADNG